MSPNDRIEIEWSYSKSKLFETCPRAFYYHYKPWKERDLSTPKNIYLDESAEDSVFHSYGALIGSAIHHAIAGEIGQWRFGENPQRQRAKATAADFIEANYDATTIHLQGSESMSSERSTVSELIATTDNHLDQFVESLWPNFRGHRYIEHEALVSMTVDQYRVWLKPDLCTRSPQGEFVITDWKTGESPILSSTSPQLRVYCLWAKATLEPNITRVRAQTAHTRNGVISPIPVRSEHLQDIRSRIVSECQRWKDSTDYDDHPAHPALRTCEKCRFLERCDQGQVVVTSGSGRSENH